MMTVTHFLATLLIGLLWSRLRPWDGREWLLAFAAGWAIDLDHLVAVPMYWKTHVAVEGLAAFRPETLKGFGHHWSGVLHEPLGFALVVALALTFDTWAPAVAYVAHQWMDWLVGQKVVVFGGFMEFGIVVLLLAATGWCLRVHLGRHFPGLSTTTWLRSWAAALVLPGEDRTP